MAASPAVTFGDGRAEEVHRAAHFLGEDVLAALEAADRLGHPAVVEHPQPEGRPLGVVARRTAGHDVTAAVDHAGLVGRVQRQVLGVPDVERHVSREPHPTLLRGPIGRRARQRPAPVGVPAGLLGGGLGVGERAKVSASTVLGANTVAVLLPRMGR